MMYARVGIPTELYMHIAAEPPPFAQQHHTCKESDVLLV